MTDTGNHSYLTAIGWVFGGEYTCKNRVVKSTISLREYWRGTTREKKFVVICRSHHILCEYSEWKIRTPALAAQRKPWLWCDECAKIHDVIWMGDVRSDDL